MSSRSLRRDYSFLSRDELVEYLSWSLPHLNGCSTVDLQALSNVIFPSNKRFTVVSQHATVFVSVTKCTREANSLEDLTILVSTQRPVLQYVSWRNLSEMRQMAGQGTRVQCCIFFPFGHQMRFCKDVPIRYSKQSLRRMSLVPPWCDKAIRSNKTNRLSIHNSLHTAPNALGLWLTIVTGKKKDEILYGTTVSCQALVLRLVKGPKKA